MLDKELLSVNKLNISFRTKYGVVQAIDDVNFKVRTGETLGIVGESGCGKSVTSLSVMGLLPQQSTLIHDGSEIIFNGENLLKKSRREMYHIRGKEISMIFQDSMTSLNPVMKIYRQISEVLLLHNRHMTKKQAYEASVEIIKKVGVPDPDRVANCYPHQLSGGMRQRIIIAMALVCEPKLLIADEPTTALDVTIQMQILDMMKKLREEFGTSIMLITHDMGVVSEMADNIIIMYAGQIVEYGSAKEIFADPLHPYTSALLASIPKLDGDKEKLYSIPGMVPNLAEMPSGCRFCGRCPYAEERCKEEQPPLMVLGDRKVRCFRYQQQAGGVSSAEQ